METGLSDESAVRLTSPRAFAIRNTAVHRMTTARATEAAIVEISGKNPAKAGLMRKIFLSDSTKGISFFVFPSVTAGGERRSFPGDGEKQFCALLRSTCDFRVVRYARKVILVPNSLLFCHRENTRNSGM